MDNKNLSLRDAATLLMGAKPEQWREFSALVQGRLDELEVERVNLQRLLKLADQFSELPPTPLTAAQKAEVYRLADEGLEAEAIAARLGLRLRQVQVSLIRRKP